MRNRRILEAARWNLTHPVKYPLYFHCKAIGLLTPEHGPPPSREHACFSLFSANWGGWVAHVSTTRPSITYLGSTKVDPTMRKESCCKWASPFVAKAASKYCMQSGFKVRSRHFWPYPTSQHQRCPKKKQNVHMEVASQCQVPDS